MQQYKVCLPTLFTLPHHMKANKQVYKYILDFFYLGGFLAVTNNVLVFM